MNNQNESIALKDENGNGEAELVMVWNKKPKEQEDNQSEEFDLKEESNDEAELAMVWNKKPSEEVDERKEEFDLKEKKTNDQAELVMMWKKIPKEQAGEQCDKFNLKEENSTGEAELAMIWNEKPKEQVNELTEKNDLKQGNIKKAYVDLAEKDEPQFNKSQTVIENCNSNIGQDNYIKKIANFRLEAEAVVNIIDGLNWYKLYRLKAYMMDGTFIKEVDINAHEFQSKEWIHKKLGVQCRVGPSENAYLIVSSELSDQFRSVEKIYIYRQVGWYKTFYGVIYSQGNNPIGNYKENIHCECNKFIEVDSKLSEKDAYFHALRMLDIAPRRTTNVMLSFTILGALRQLFEDSGNIPRFLVWMVAETGSYKTTLAKEFAIIFNRTKNDLTASFKDTAASLEVKAAEYKDSVLIVDDYFPASSSYERNQLNLGADHIIRLFGDSISKSRMNSKMEKQKEYKPSGVCMVSAEDTHGSTSSRSRCLHLHLDKNSVDLEVLSYCQDNPKYFSTFIYNFIEYIAANYEIYVKEIRHKFKTYREAYRSKFKHGRLLDAYISLMISFEILMEYGVFINAIDNDKRIEESNLASENFWELVMEMTYDIYSDEPGVLYAKAVEELISSNMIHLSKSQDNKQERHGWDQDGYYYLYPDLMLAAVVKFYNDQGRKYSASKTKSHLALDALGLIEKDGNKRTVKKIFYGSKRKRYLVVDKDKLSKLLLEF